MAHTLQDVLQLFMIKKGMSAKSLAAKAGISYPTMLNIIKTGNIPRKPQHREILRTLLDIEHDEWADILSRSGKNQGLCAGSADSNGMATLQSMITRALYAKGLSEKTLATATGLPYATISGITHKGAVPRSASLRLIVDALDLDAHEVDKAVRSSHASRHQDLDHTDSFADNDSLASIADIMSQRLAESGSSLAQFAQKLDIGYISLSQLMNGKYPDNDMKRFENLRLNLGLSDAEFAAAIYMTDRPKEITSLSIRGRHPVPDNAVPLQKALIAYMNRANLTIKGLAEKSGLSQLTMARIVKQQATPSRATTHKKLQDLLELDHASYLDLINGEQKTGRLAQAGAHRTSSKNGQIDAGIADYVSHDALESNQDNEFDPTPSTDRLIAQLNCKHGNRDDIINIVKTLDNKQCAALCEFLTLIVKEK